MLVCCDLVCGSLVCAQVLNYLEKLLESSKLREQRENIKKWKLRLPVRASLIFFVL